MPTTDFIRFIATVREATNANPAGEGEVGEITVAAIVAVITRAVVAEDEGAAAEVWGAGVDHDLKKLRVPIVV